MNEKIIVMNVNDKTKRFISKNEDMTCEIEIDKSGIFSGIIQKMHSNGNYEVLLMEKLNQ